MNAPLKDVKGRGRGPGYFRWPTIVVALLATHVGLMAWAASVAVKRGQAPVIENYYQKALRWDEDRRAREAAAASQPAVKEPTAPGTTR